MRNENQIKVRFNYETNPVQFGLALKFLCENFRANFKKIKEKAKKYEETKTKK